MIAFIIYTPYEGKKRGLTSHTHLVLHGILQRVGQRGEEIIAGDTLHLVYGVIVQIWNPAYMSKHVPFHFAVFCFLRPSWYHVVTTMSLPVRGREKVFHASMSEAYKL